MQKDKISSRQQAEWFGLLKDLLDSGFSLKQAVRFSATLKETTAALGRHVDQGLEHGKTLAASLKDKIPIDVYYQLYLAEKHGSLRSTLSAISNHYALKEKEQQRLKSLLAYPCMLLGLLLIIFVGIRIFIMPQLADLSGKSSAITHTVMSYLISVVVTGGLIMGWRLRTFRRQDQLKKVEIMARLPLVGKLFETYYAYYVCDGLSLMLKQGMSLQEICDSLSQYSETSLLFQLAQRYSSLNHDLSLMLKRVNFLPREVGVLLNRGLTTREVGDQLAMLARMKFSQLEQLYETRLAMVQPILFGIIALSIIGMYLSILLPIYHSMQGVLP